MLYFGYWKTIYMNWSYVVITRNYNLAHGNVLWGYIFSKQDNCHNIQWIKVICRLDKYASLKKCWIVGSLLISYKTFDILPVSYLFDRCKHMLITHLWPLQTYDPPPNNDWTSKTPFAPTPLEIHLLYLPRPRNQWQLTP